MRDPDVVALHYRVVTDSESFEFKDPPPVEAEEAAFRLRLEAGNLRVEMKVQHATAESARSVVDPFLDAWEVAAALAPRYRGRREMRFAFERAEIVDRNPPGPGERSEIAGSGTMTARGEARFKIIAPAYPDPPRGFIVSADVQVLIARYERYLAGRSLLLDTANWCLTLLEARGLAAAHSRGLGKLAKRDAAAKVYGVADMVLATLGELCARRGDAATARKFDPTGTPLTPAEVTWIEAAVRRLIRRVGEHDYDPAAARPTITMADLPTL
jgi:hypothetical protein